MPDLIGLMQKKITEDETTSSPVIIAEKLVKEPNRATVLNLKQYPCISPLSLLLYSAFLIAGSVRFSNYETLLAYYYYQYSLFPFRIRTWNISNLVAILDSQVTQSNNLYLQYYQIIEIPFQYWPLNDTNKNSASAYLMMLLVRIFNTVSFAAQWVLSQVYYRDPIGYSSFNAMMSLYFAAVDIVVIGKLYTYVDFWDIFAVGVNFLLNFMPMVNLKGPILAKLNAFISMP